MSETFLFPERQKMTQEPIVRFSRTDQEGIERKFVAVLGVELPVYEGADGSIFRDEEFADFSHDEASIDLLKRYATAVKLNQPLLVEGETDIGKTKALEYLHRHVGTVSGGVEGSRWQANRARHVPHLQVLG